MDDLPTLTGPFIKDNTIQFKCTVAFTPDQANGPERFEVTFQFDNMADPNVPVQTLDSTNLEATLQEWYWSGKMGKAVS